MKLPKRNLFRRCLTLVTLAFGWLCDGELAFAQTTSAGGNTGTIQGRVYNPASKEYVRNAEVRLEGTKEVTYSETDGSFQFNKVPAGPATIAITFTGYKSVTETFQVTGGQTAVREINLVSTEMAQAPPGKTGPVQLQAFTVSTEREGNSKAIMEQRRSMDIMTSVSSDIFGDVTDGNVGEFLKYLPGVDLDYVESEARGPRLGGMEGQYVGVSFDGIRTASADANRGGGDASRATSFEGFSITAIESIEVTRTRSPESDGDSPAGTINMRTKRAFARKGRHMAFNFGLNFNDEEFHLKRTWGPDEMKDYKFRPNISLDYSESFLNQRLGILMSFSRATSYTEQYSFVNSYNRSATVADPRPMVIRSIDFKDGPKNISKDSFLFTIDYQATPRLVLSLNAIYNYTEGEFWNRNFTFVAANDNANVNNGRSRVGGDGMLTVSTARTTANTVPALNNGGGSSSKLTYTRTLSPRFEYKLGAWLFDGAMAYSRSVNNYEALERGFAEAESTAVASDWVATRPSRESWEWKIRQTSGADWFYLGNWTGGTRVENSAREWATEIWSGQASAAWALPFMRKFPTKIKFGGKWNEETRKNSNEDTWNTWRYIGPGGDVLTGYNATTGVPNVTTSGNWNNLGYVAPHKFDTGTTNALTMVNIFGNQGMAPRADRNRMGALFRQHPELFVNVATPDNYYNAFIVPRRDFRQTVTSAYAQADVRVTSQLQVRGGVRWEHTKSEVNEWQSRLRDEVAAAGYPVNTSGRATTFTGLHYQYQSLPRITRSAEYDSYFPSLSAKYNILRNLELQFGYSKAIGRPPIDSLAGLWNIVEDAAGVTQRVDAPNPNLKPEDITKYDLRLAYYFSGKAPGQISVSVNEADITNQRETFDFTAEEFGVDDPEFADYTFRSTRNSTGRRRSRNLEFSYNQTLGFLPTKLRGLSFNVTYARAYQNARRNGLAPHRVSSRLNYSYRKFSTGVGMVWTDRKPDGIYGRFVERLTQFDLSANWRLTGTYSIYLQARNITGAPVKWMESPPGSVEGKNVALRQYQRYGANWVFGCRGTF
jgi:iron complex outermembrane receptor protein